MRDNGAEQVRVRTRGGTARSTSRPPRYGCCFSGRMSDATFRDLLMHDHERLDGQLQAILELGCIDDTPDLDRAWGAFEDGLLAHLDGEEMFLLPTLARDDPATATRIRDEHAELRSHVAEIGIGLELHNVREERLRVLAAQLRAHAKMEEAPLYGWADTALPPSHFTSLVRRLRRARRLDT